MLKRMIFLLLITVCSYSYVQAVPPSIFTKIVDLNAQTCGCDGPPPKPESRLGLLGDKNSGSLPPRPNIVLIVSDDVDREWIGAYRSDGRSITPNIDRLGRNGVVFLNAYSAASTCAPSRYAMLTGRWPSRSPATATFVRDLIPNVKLPDDCEAHYKVNGTVLDPSESNIAHELKALGYRTGFVGKWHCSSEIAMMHSPLRDRQHLYSWMQQQVTDRGFDSADGLYFTNVPQLRSKLGGDIHHHQEWLTDLAVDFIKKSSVYASGSTPSESSSSESSLLSGKRKPFFLVMASTLPHGPDLPLWPKENETMRTVAGDVVEQAEIVEIRKKRQSAHARCKDVEFFNGFDKLVKHRHSSIRWLVQYIALKGNECAKMVLFDDAVGSIVTALKEANQFKDTLLIYTTDHGWTDKGFGYEGGSHIPLIMHWPRLFENHMPFLQMTGSASGEESNSGRGLRLSQLVSTIDIAATSLHAASRGALSSLNSMDSESLIPLLLNSNDKYRKHRDLVYVENGWSRAAVSTNGYKLIRTFFPRLLNRQWSREPGGVRINPYFGAGCVHDWWATSVAKHGNFFDRHQFFDLNSDKYEQRSLYRALKPPGGGGEASAFSKLPNEMNINNNPILKELEIMYEELLDQTKRTKKCSEVCAVSYFGHHVAERNKKIYQQYIQVLNLRNESRNFLTNWFQWTERFRAADNNNK